MLRYAHYFHPKYLKPAGHIVTHLIETVLFARTIYVEQLSMSTYI